MPAGTAHSGKNSGHKGERGFTLIEMSVVLTIVGLIVAGILAGKTMIRESQINSAMADAQRYIAAAKNFQQQYGSLPGDMSNATTYWGAMSTCPATPGSASPGGTLTCNGDGNGQVWSYVVLMNPLTSLAQNSVNENEAVLFWQHLVNAQLIQGNYTGIAGSAGALDGVIGTNCPAGRLPGLGFGIFYAGVLSGDAIMFDGNYGHVIFLGSYISNNVPLNPILTTLEAQSFDNKFDDGLPAYGNVRAFKNANGVESQYCATTNVSSTALYNTSATGTNSTGLQCDVTLITGF